MLAEATLAGSAIADDFTFTDPYVPPEGNAIVDAIDAVTASMAALAALLTDLRGMLAAP